MRVQGVFPHLFLYMDPDIRIQGKVLILTAGNLIMPHFNFITVKIFLFGFIKMPSSIYWNGISNVCHQNNRRGHVIGIF